MSSNEKPEPDHLGDVTEPAPLVRKEPDTLELALDAELVASGEAARQNAGELREQLSLWIAQRLSFCSRETKLLQALRQQVDEAAKQKTADATARYLAQAVHIRSEILALRGERNALTIEGAREGSPQ